MGNFYVAVLAGIALATGFYFVIKSIRTRGETKSSPWALFLIFPKEEDATREIQKAEKLLTLLAGFRESFALEAVIPHVGDRIHFYVVVRRQLANKVFSSLTRLFGKAAVERIHDDHIVFSPHGASFAAHLTQKEHAAIPFPVYREMGADMFKDVLHAIREVAAIGEGAAIQFVVSPMNVKKFRSGCEKLHLPPVAQEKLQSPLFELNARVVVSAGSEFRARGLLDDILKGFEKFKGQGRNALRRMVPRSSKNLIRQFLDREFDADQSLILSREEFANVYHCSLFPQREGV